MMLAVVGPGPTSSVPASVPDDLLAAMCGHATVRRIDVDTTAGAFGARGASAWVDPGCDLAVAVIWPGLRLTWLRRFFAAVDVSMTPAAILYCSVPASAARTWVRPLWEAGARPADLVITGDDIDATRLRRRMGPWGPQVETHDALRFRTTTPDWPSARVDDPQDRERRLVREELRQPPASAWPSLVHRLLDFARDSRPRARLAAAVR
jgi:hypothetical protein